MQELQEKLIKHSANLEVLSRLQAALDEFDHFRLATAAAAKRRSGSVKLKMILKVPRLQQACNPRPRREPALLLRAGQLLTTTVATRLWVVHRPANAAGAARLNVIKLNVRC